MKCWILPTMLLMLGIILEIFADDLVVKLNHGGSVRGSIMKSQKGKTIFAFRGIPYAEPPTGSMRFKPPVPKSPFQENPLDATKDGSPCVQVDMITHTLIGQEDCLFLNVYSPELPDDDDDNDDNDEDDDDDNRPVLVFIHGGGFAFGHAASNMYGPEVLLDGNIVLVTMNYRLGPLGFLSTGDDVSSGNYGLMDQSLALKWVHENIEAFGGDANRVTIVGQSAGGASVGYHLLSPMSSGYFHAAISQSGTPLCPWAFQKDPRYWTKQLASMLKCSSHSSAEIVDCLRGLPAQEIMKTSIAQIPHTILPLIYTPTLDGKFLTMEPREAMKSGKVVNKVPYVTGVTEEEGTFLYMGILRDDPSWDLTSINDIQEILTLILDDQGRSDEPGNLVIKKYFAGLDTNDKELLRKTVFSTFSDSIFDMSNYETARLLSDHGIPTYVYSLDYPPSVAFWSLLGQKESWGVGHADELFLMFGGEVFGLKKPTDDDKKVTKIIRTLWTNFATYGDPTPNKTKLLPVDWEPSRSGKLQVLHISTELKTSTYDTNKEGLYSFWTDRVQKVLDKVRQQEQKDEL